MGRFEFLQPIKVRLWIAFLAVAVVSVIGATAAVISDEALSVTIRHFGEATLPDMVAAQNMLNVKVSLNEDTRALAKAPNADELSKRSLAARAEIANLRSVAQERLQASSNNSDVKALGGLIENVEGSLKAVEQATSTHLATHARRAELLEGMEDATKVAHSTAEPLARHLRELLAQRIASGDPRHLMELGKNEVAWLMALQRRRSDLDIVSGLLASIAASENESTLRGLEAELSIAAPRLGGDGGLPDTPLTGVFNSGKDALLSFTQSEDSLVEARSQELTAEKEVEDAVAACTKASDSLAQALAQFADHRSAASGEAIHAASRQIQMAMLLQIVLALLALATAGLIGWFYVKNSLVRRMLSLRDAMRAVAGGALDHPITVSGGDEIGAMADALIVFRDNAQKMAELRTQRESERLQAEQDRRQALLSMADTLQSGAGNLLSGVAEATTQLRGMSLDMSKTAEAAVHETDKLADATLQASLKVDSAVTSANAISTSIQEISRHVAGSTQASAKARDEAGTAQQTVSQLKEAASKIGDIINLIRSIAQKTNLLALNATIEAARAGEAGKGFVIVAGEVKDLANQTAGATGEIERQVASMQAATDATVTSIGAILSTIEHANDLNMSASASLEEQAQMTGEIAHSMADTAELIVAVQASMKTVTESVHASEGTATTLSSATSRLSSDTKNLGEEVSRFLGQIRGK